MTTFEVWQVTNMTIQSILLFAAFLGALYVGLKQYEINQQLVELQHQPSAEVAASEDRLHILNKGSHNLWLRGTQVDSDSKSIEADPRLITPQGNYYISLETLKTRILQAVGNYGETRLNLNIFVSTIGDRRYTIKNILLCKVQDGKVAIHSQTIGISQED